MDVELSSEIAIKKILEARTDLEVLQIAKAKNNKKAFQKLSLLVHPDKCKDQNATKAFLRLKIAFENKNTVSYEIPKPEPSRNWYWSPPPKEAPQKPDTSKFKTSNNRSKKKRPTMSGH